MSIKVSVMKFFLVLVLTLILNNSIFGSENNGSSQLANYKDRCDPDTVTSCFHPPTLSRLNKLTGYLERSQNVTRLGMTCITENDCDKIRHAICSKDKKCVCRANSVQLNKTTCSLLLGEFCWKNESCAPDNSHCIDNVCQCNDNYAQISNQLCRLKTEESRIVPILGTTCIHDENCNEILYAKCSEEKKCVCRINNVQINETTCAPLLGEFCWKNESCAPDNSHCVKSECKCNDNYAQISNLLCRLKSRIVPILGMTCFHDKDCNEIRYAKCSEKNSCVCRANNVQINEMACAPLLGEFCWKNELCTIDNSHCIDNVCKCKDNYLQEFDSFCIPRTLGLSCRDDADCGKMDGIKCFNATVCKSLLDGFCLLDNDCMPRNSFCIHSKCICKLNYQPSYNTQCVPTPEEFGCEQDADCSSIKYAVCSDEKKCGCGKGYFLMNALCLPTISKSCQNNEPCAHDNSLCIDNVCQCKPNYVYHEFKCIPTQLNESCEIDSDCNNIMFAMCSLQKRCICEDKYKQLNKRTCTPILGGLCSKNEQCNVESSVCMINHCRCQFLFVEISPEKCIPWELGLPCYDHKDCKLIDNSECSESKICVCKVNHFSKNQRQCERSLNALGSSCDTDTDCNDLKYAECSDLWRCDCQLGYIKFNSTTCIEKHELISKTCSADCECKEIKNSRCSENNKCICGANNFAINSLECKSLLNGICSENIDCITINSVCINNRCQCRVYYAPESNEKCVPRSQCRNYFDCQALTNAVCSKSKICVCAEDNYALSNSTCLPVIGSYCEFNINCLSDLLNCINYRCQCRQGYVSISESQCVKRHLAYQCQNTLECGEPWHSVCSEDKVCTCKANNYAENKSTCLPQINGYCFLDRQCTVKHSVCDDFKCKCKPNFQAIANNLCLPV